MEGLLMVIGFAGLFFCIFILLNRTGTLLDTIEALQKKLQVMAKDVNDVRSELQRIKSLDKIRTEEAPVSKPETIITPPVIKEEVKEVIVPEIPVEEKVIKPEPFVFEHKAERPLFVPTTEPVKPKVVKPKEPSFFERNPDIEKFIGENLINKIGIAILVLGIGFFVKFAIDQGWIPPAGRVLIGIACGAILVGIAHYTRNTFRAFSSVLVGGGLAVFYLTITIAFQEYKLMPQTLAFIIMVIITLFAVILSIFYDRKELAILAIIGGFASPFMVSTGGGNYQVLFTYIAVLNIGMIVLSYFKRWNAINVIAFVFTILLYAGWLIKTFNYDEEPLPYVGALLFATLFYVLFFAMNIVNNIKENKSFVLFQLSILISNTFLYYSAGMFILKGIHGGLYQGLFTILIASFNFIFAYVLYKNKKVDSNLVYLLIGLVLTFVTLSAPIQLEGNYITLFWAAETVLLLWLSQKSGIQLMKIASFIINALMFISLLLDWHHAYSTFDGILPLFINKAFVATIVVIASISATILLLKKETNETLFGALGIKEYASVLEIAFLVVAYFGGLLEVYYQFESRLGLLQSYVDITPIYTCCYNLIFILLFALYVRFRKVALLELFPIIACIVISAAYLIYYNTIVLDLRNEYLMRSPELGFHYYFHYVNVVLLLILLGYTFIWMKNKFAKNATQFSVYLWFMSFAVIYIASAELLNLVLVSSFKSDEDLYSVSHQVYKVGFPILWGVGSFILMILGMKFKVKTLRIISLTIFGVTLLKMFIFDIREMSEGGKIAAFISLGVLLLIISFMYQKLKKILTEE
ncbi:DUF2339 domain-containing protein [Cytophaga aurantiaca]|uniref:DUF2339 domain-containing protein n=1 Tax=Cytophaga aurantiaca TaxID=29530 RepID=UPI00037B26E4|nr:DUF2339 domain-containing protein [Cytophaga aurantiaca]